LFIKRGGRLSRTIGILVIRPGSAYLVIWLIKVGYDLGRVNKKNYFIKIILFNVFYRDKKRN
jgi:hypothetical protein